MGRIISDFPNITAPGGDYPYGRIKDNPGDGSGTPVNEFTNGDIHQFFARLMTLAGIASNGLPDNVTNGFQLIEALVKLFQQTASGAILKTKVIEIGDWNMDTTDLVVVNHGLDHTKIRTVTVTVRNDPEEFIYQSGFSADNDLIDMRIDVVSDTVVQIVRRLGGFFDNAGFSAVGYNRGWITILYEG